MRLLCRKCSDEIFALGGFILTCWAGWNELERSGRGLLPRSRHEEVIRAWALQE